MRERSTSVHAKINEKLIGTFKGTEEERLVKISNDTEIPVTIYTPVDAKKDKMVVYFHGGGWTIGSQYRLGPEYKFPIWLDDACEVTQHILANKTSY
ncbi:unnamed protein product, partial [Adineta ricciae]